MNEADVSAKIRVKLVEYGAVAWKVSDRFHASRPDLIACYNGQFIAIETKIYPNAPTIAQDYILRELVKAGAQAYCIAYAKRTKLYLTTSYNSGETTSHSSTKDVVAWVLKLSSSNTKSVS